VTPSSDGQKLGQVRADASLITHWSASSRGWGMRGFHNNAFDPQTLVLLETAFCIAFML
jgi:hypothetical protein